MNQIKTAVDMKYSGFSENKCDVIRVVFSVYTVC